MKTLSNYRIRERNELFIVEVKKVITTKRFLRKDRNSFVWEYCCVCDTLEKAKEQIVQRCKEPKYHYVNNTPCPWDLLQADIVFINESLKINPLFYKLIEKYEEKVKTGCNPKTIEKPYADLALENIELKEKVKELNNDIDLMRQEMDSTYERLNKKVLEIRKQAKNK